MKNTFGNQVSITLFGESHGAAIGAVLDGLAPGIPVDEDEIRHQLALRRAADDDFSVPYIVCVKGVHGLPHFEQHEVGDVDDGRDGTNVRKR